MDIRKRLFSCSINCLKAGINIFAGNKATAVAAILSEELTPISKQQTNHGDIKFFCPGRIPEWRAQTLLTKEPETIEWIDSFHKTDTLWDIGANVGLYSLYAALKGLSVIAFEPSAGNYYLLNRNIEINKMNDRISAICIAFTDTNKLDSFYMQTTQLGSALNSFGETIDWQGNQLDSLIKQATIGFNIDDFIDKYNPPFPNHIKIDVDGIENKIIEGAKTTLKDKRLKSMLVELDTGRKEYCSNAIKLIESAGLVFYKKEHAPEFDNTEFNNIYNHIFIRPDTLENQRIH